jgi:hypothetical protein
MNKKIKKEFVYYLETYQKNRIVNKIMRKLEGQKYSVNLVQSVEDSRIFEIRVFSDQLERVVTSDLKQTICDIIKDTFPLNYQFDFSTRRLGFTYAFNVFYTKNSFRFECYTRVKEIRKDGSSVLPEVNNQIK